MGFGYIDINGFVTAAFEGDLSLLDGQFKANESQIISKIYEYVKESFVKITVVPSLKIETKLIDG